MHYFSTLTELDMIKNTKSLFYQLTNKQFGTMWGNMYSN